MGFGGFAWRSTIGSVLSTGVNSAVFPEFDHGVDAAAAVDGKSAVHHCLEPQTGFHTITCDYAPDGATGLIFQGNEVAMRTTSNEAVRGRAKSGDTKKNLVSIRPSFIVTDLQASISKYRERLGFQLDFQGPDDGPFWAGVSRDGIRILPAHCPWPSGQCLKLAAKGCVEADTCSDTSAVREASSLRGRQRRQCQFLERNVVKKVVMADRPDRLDIALAFHGDEEVGPRRLGRQVHRRARSTRSGPS